MDETQLPFLREVILTVVEPICIVILIISIRKTRVSRWVRRYIRQVEAENKESERPKVGFQKTAGTGEDKELKKFLKWPDVIRKWLQGDYHTVRQNEFQASKGGDTVCNH